MRHPTHPHPCKHRSEEPATDPTTPGPFHTPSKLGAVLDTGRNSDGSQHVDDSTSEHPNAGRTDAYRAVPNEWVGVCSLERR